MELFWDYTKEGPINIFIKRSRDILDELKGLQNLPPGGDHHLPCQSGLPTFLVSHAQNVELRQSQWKIVNCKRTELSIIGDLSLTHSLTFSKRTFKEKVPSI